MGSEIKVTKRTGDREPLDLEKLHKVVFYACEDITGVSASEVELKSHIQFYDGIKTEDIQETLIKAASDLISDETPNYQWVAGRLINYHLRKMVYNQFEPWHIYDLVKKNVADGFYDEDLLVDYTKEEWEREIRSISKQGKSRLRDMIGKVKNRDKAAAAAKQAKEAGNLRHLS